MYMVVLKLRMSSLFFPISKQVQSLKKPHRKAYPILPLPRETTENLDYASYSDGG